MPFCISERDDSDGARRLALTGELDLATVPELRTRLRELSADHRTVRLDFSRLDFMDSTGIHIIYSALQHSMSDGWNLEVDPDLSPPAARVIALTGLDHHLWPADRR
jgi:anti-anti-sigma factor